MRNCRLEVASAKRTRPTLRVLSFPFVSNRKGGSWQIGVRRNIASSTIALAAFVLSLSSGHTLRAQQSSVPTLDEILARLEHNLQIYETTVPSFFCDEHVVSGVIPSIGIPDTVSDGIFRLKRIVNPDKTINLEESRLVKTVNGKPADAEDLNGPVVLKGAFSGGLAIVSLGQKTCMRYSLRPIKASHPDAPYIVQFESTFDIKHSTNCLLREPVEAASSLIHTPCRSRRSN